MEKKSSMFSKFLIRGLGNSMKYLVENLRSVEMVNSFLKEKNTLVSLNLPIDDFFAQINTFKPYLDKVFFEFGDEANTDDLLRLKESGVKNLQIPSYRLGNEMKNALSKEKFNVMVKYMDVGDDFQPNWLSEAFDEQAFASCFHVELLNDMNKPWEFLKYESSKFPNDCIQISDIIELTNRYRLWLSLETTIENICEIRDTFKDAKGLVFRIKDGDNQYINSFAIEEIKEMLNLMNCRNT